MTLDVKKIYIDTRYRTSNSKSASDFSIELPRSFEVPDNTVCFIDDIVLPVSWLTLDSRNDTCYMKLTYNGDVYYLSFTMTHHNYDGFSFTTEFQDKIDAVLTPHPIAFTAEYILRNNTLKLSFIDGRPQIEQDWSLMTLTFLSDDTLMHGGFNGTVIPEPATINGFIRNTNDILLYYQSIHNSFLDLISVRNVYLVSSALASYDTISNFKLDTIVKKIPVTVGTNEMITHVGGNTIDYLNVSKRNLRYIDFKIVDSYFRPIDMRNNHFSFSIIFEHKR